MKNTIYLVFGIALLISSCGSPNKTISEAKKENPVRIANDSLAYEITILDIGFNSYLAMAKPMNYYTQQYLETRNRVYVVTWNERARNPSRYDSSIYENEIEYKPFVDYGMEVNYKLYQYFQFAQQKYKMRLGNFR